MDPGSDNNVKGIVEEMAQDRGRNIRSSGTRRRADGPATGTVRTLVFGGIAAAVLLAAILLLIGNGETDTDRTLAFVAARLDRIEATLDRVEDREKQMSALATRIEGVVDSVSRLERDRRTLSAEIETLKRRLEAAIKRPPAQGPTSPAASEEAPTHTVRRGDTLFSIAKLYGLSVDEIRRLNGIEETDVIQPGQVLIVGTEER